MIKEYLKDISTPETAQLLKKPKKLQFDKWGKAYSQDKNDYDLNGKLVNGGKLFEEQRKQTETSKGIQVALNQLGQRDKQGKELKIDGIFGPKTQTALNNYWQTNYPNEENPLKNIISEAPKIQANPYTITPNKSSINGGNIKNTLNVLNDKYSKNYMRLLDNKNPFETIKTYNTFSKGNSLYDSAQGIALNTQVKKPDKSLQKPSFENYTFPMASRDIFKRQAAEKPVLENILAPDKISSATKEEVDEYLKELFKNDEWAQYGLDREFWENEAKEQEEKWKEKTDMVGNIVGIPKFLLPQLTNFTDSILNIKTKPAERNAILDFPIEGSNYILRGLDNLAKRAKDKVYGTLEQNLLNYDGALPNAFLHTYWNALMAHYGGEEAAKSFATAHEVQTNKAVNEGWFDENPNEEIKPEGKPKGIVDNFTGEQQLWMDMHNNEVGRKIAKKLKGVDVHEELLKYYDESEEKLKNVRKEYKYFSEVDLLLLHLSAEAVKNGDAMWLVQN